MLRKILVNLPCQSLDSTIREEETGLIISDGLNPSLKTHRSSAVGDLFTCSALHTDLVPVPLWDWLVAGNPDPEVVVASLTSLAPPRYQEEEEVVIVADTLGTPPPVLMILDDENEESSDLHQEKHTCIEWMYVAVEMEEVNEFDSGSSLWCRKS